jgi:hypothetical protein
VLKDEEILLSYGKEGKEKHRSRRIAYWDAENERLFEFIIKRTTGLCSLI